MRLDAGTRLGPYEIVEPIGAGGMGEVYRARDTRLDRTVAIKVLPRHLSADPRLAERFEREARSLSGFSHPHICTLHDVGESDGVRFLVMEYLEGVSLAERLKQGPLPPEQLLRYGAEIADALDAAHRHGVVHRDLKPANIMLTGSGAKLVDFGLARSGGPLTNSAPSGATEAPTRSVNPLTAEGRIVGTLHYMAPEQAEGREADARSDIFALGAVLYEMGTGRKAFSGESPAGIIAAILSSKPAPMSALQPATPPALDRLVRRCLASDPEERWQSARDAMLELKWIGEADEEPDGSAPGPDRRRVRERVAWIVAVVALAGALGLALVFSERSRDESGPIRLSIPLPQDARVGLVRVSPDGRHFAYAMATEGQRQLWLRSADGRSERPLPDSDGAAAPFWSPDSRFIGFFAEGVLKKIDIAGGPPQILCDAPGEFSNGTWSRDGTILFSIIEAPGLEGLSRVSATGGPAARVTLLDESGKEFLGIYPSFLPDGRHFLVRCMQDDFDDKGICLASLDTGRARQLVDSRTPVSRAEYAAPGYLLYLRGETLLAQPFDLDGFHLRGDPVPLAEQVEHYGPGGLANVSVSDAGILTYVVGSAPSRLLLMSREGQVIDELDVPGDYYDLSFSPDGRKLAVSRNDRRTQASDIWMIELARDVATRFTDLAMDAMSPTWSPDGSRIAFCQADDAPPFLHVRSLTGDESEVLLPSTGTLQCPSDWSPDGRFLLYVDRHPTNGYDTWLLPLTGQDREPIPFLVSRFNEGAAAFSPDGRWVAFSSDESGRFEVYLQPFEREGRMQRISTSGGTFPRWRDDGRELFYVSGDGQVMAAPVLPGEEFPSGPAAPLFSISVLRTVLRPYDVSPDGQRFAVLSTHGSSRQPSVVVNWAEDLPR